jgi:hypothetical protein
MLEKFAYLLNELNHHDQYKISIAVWRRAIPFFHLCEDILHLSQTITIISSSSKVI